MSLRNTLIRIACVLAILICIAKYNLNPSGLTIAIALLVVLFTVPPIETIEIDHGYLIYEKKWAWGLFKEHSEVQFSEIEQVKIFDQYNNWLHEINEWRFVITLKVIFNYLEFDLHKGGKISFKTQYTQFELKKIMAKALEYGLKPECIATKVID